MVETADPGLPAASDRLGRRLFSGLVVASTTLAGALVLPHQMVASLALFVVAALILVLHVVRYRRRARQLTP
ncbi:hypothetical protein BH11MYX4_BH11MYX4_55880 [soil metagenome]